VLKPFDEAAADDIGKNAGAMPEGGTGGKVGGNAPAIGGEDAAGCEEGGGGADGRGGGASGGGGGGGDAPPAKEAEGWASEKAGGRGFEKEAAKAWALDWVAVAAANRRFCSMLAANATQRAIISWAALVSALVARFCRPFPALPGSELLAFLFLPFCTSSAPFLTTFGAVSDPPASKIVTRSADRSSSGRLAASFSTLKGTKRTAD